MAVGGASASPPSQSAPQPCLPRHPPCWLGVSASSQSFPFQLKLRLPSPRQLHSTCSLLTVVFCFVFFSSLTLRPWFVTYCLWEGLASWTSPSLDSNLEVWLQKILFFPLHFFLFSCISIHFIYVSIVMSEIVQLFIRLCIIWLSFLCELHVHIFLSISFSII